MKPIKPNFIDFVEYFDNICSSRQFSNNGRYVQELEQKLKQLFQVGNNILCNNGTMALMIALKALNVRAGVITTPFTFPATVNVLPWVDCYPVFCDINYETMNITPERAEKYISPYTTAILPVHVFGNACDVSGFADIAKKHNLKIVYDAAHAFDVRINNNSIGNFGDATIFSFHPTKLFHTAEGGMITFKDPELYPVMKQYLNFGIKDDETGSVLPGINGKMNELQAAMGLCILKKIKEERQKRKKVESLYKKYLESLVPRIKVLYFNELTTKKSFQYFPIRINDNSRNKVHEKLLKENIYSRKYFYPLCSDFPHFKSDRDFPNARKVSEEILCLPFYGDLTEPDIIKICEIIGDAI